MRGYVKSKPSHSTSRGVTGPGERILKQDWKRERERERERDEIQGTIVFSDLE